MKRNGKKNMRKFIAFLMCLFLSCIAIGCDDNNDNSDGAKTPNVNNGGSITGKDDQGCPGNPWANRCENCAACSTKYGISLKCDTVNQVCVDDPNGNNDDPTTGTDDQGCPGNPLTNSCENCAACSTKYGISLRCDTENQVCVDDK